MLDVLRGAIALRDVFLWIGADVSQKLHVGSFQRSVFFLETTAMRESLKF